jgi:hypothetical protein
MHHALQCPYDFREVTCIRLQYRLLLKGHISVHNRRWMHGCKAFPVMGSVEFLWITMNLLVWTWFILFCQYWLMLNRMMFPNLCQHFKVVDFLWITMISSCGDHSTFPNALSFAEEKFCLVMCSPDTLQIFCWCYMVSF